MDKKPTSEARGSRVVVIRPQGSLSADERVAMVDAYQVLNAFRAVNPLMSLQLASSFLLVAHEEGLMVSEYAKRAGISQGVMSRHIADLGEFDRKHDTGLKLVYSKVDVMDRRRSMVFLTPKGRAVAAQVSWAMSCANR